MATTPQTSANQPAILRCDTSPSQMRYWDGRDWAGGPVASIGSRCWGNALDVLLASVLFFVFFLLFAIPVPTTPGPEPVANPTGMTIAFFAAILLGFVGYFVLSYRFWGRTIGMQAAGTYLVHIPSGAERLSWGSAILRAIVLSAGYICGVLWLIWLLIAATSKTKQGPHDLAAKTGVLSSRDPTFAPPPQSPTMAPSEQLGEISSTSSPGLPVQEPLDPAEYPKTPPKEAARALPSAQAEPAQEPTPSSAAPNPASAGNDPQTTIFISHASQDSDIAQGLAAALEAQGLGTWLASRDVSIGANYAAEIFQNLVNSDYLLVVLSASSIESAHVRREVSIAIDRKVPVLPVSTDPSGELMANLPEDWQYWLNIAQVFRMTDESSTAVEIARRVK